jgi:hypothetical protein
LCVASLLVLASCGAEDVDKFASVSLHVQHGVERGIPIARALRQEGKLTAEYNLRLARKAKLVNSLHRETIDLVLSSDPDGGTLHDKLQALIAGAKDLQSDGTIGSEVLFDLGVSLAEAELQDLADSLKGKRGVKLPVTPAAREKLGRAKSASERNGTSLDEAIRLLTPPE